jgi:TolB-like protein/tetratricopeptide (TPR) repeat protein
MTTDPKGVYEFGPFRLDLGRRALFRGEELLPLAPKSMDTLSLLMESAGAAVDKATLLSRVWSDTAVEENSLAKAISEIRRALGEEARTAAIIVTVPGHGYRFGAAVNRVRPGNQSNRLAVLPLLNLSGNAADEYLAVGLADALITRLSRIQRVVVRPTSAILKFADRERDAVAAARQLDADSVVEGTLRRDGDRFRVTVQLVSARTGAIEWANTFDENVTDIFALEDVIAERIVAALTLTLTGEEQRSLRKTTTHNGAAYESYLEGRFHWNKRTAEGCERAIACFERAIVSDPNYAQAYSGLADAHVALGIQGIVLSGLSPSATFPRARTAIASALSLDDGVAEVYTSLGQVNFFYDWDFTAAEKAYRRSLDLNPNYATGHHSYAMALTFMNRQAAAMAEIEQARALEPFSPIINANLGRVLYHARRYEEAIAHLEKTLELDPSFVLTHHRLGLAFEANGMYEEATREFTIVQRLSAGGPFATAALGCVYAMSGRRSDAERLLESLLETARQQYVAAPLIAEMCIGLGDYDRAFGWLDRGVEERSSVLVGLLVNPRYEPVRDDPRFQRLVERVGLDLVTR